MALETKKKGNLYTITCGSRTEIINSRLEQEDGNPKAKAVAIKRKKKKFELKNQTNVRQCLRQKRKRKEMENSRKTQLYGQKNEMVITAHELHFFRLD